MLNFGYAVPDQVYLPNGFFGIVDIVPVAYHSPTCRFELVGDAILKNEAGLAYLCLKLG